jgi:group I intron endonuclease
MKVIYKITCVENGKFYIGSTVNKTQRWARHRRDLRDGTHPNKNLLASWVKYGEAAFLFEVLEEVADEVLLFAAEQRYLDEHVGRDYCFNHNKYADSPMRGKSGADTPNFGKPVSPEVRAKISAGVSGPRNAHWGVPVPEDRKQRIRESNLKYPHKGRKHTPEAIAKIAAASTGRPVSDETRAKRSAALKGREIPLEQRIRISRTLSGEGNYWYGKERPESFKEKIRKAVVATQADGTETRYESIQALREATGLKPPTVNRALKSGEPLVRGPFKGWQFQYAVT